MEVNETYHRFLEQVLSGGTPRAAQRGQQEGTLECFGLTLPMVFDLQGGIPVISTKRVWVRGIVSELLWFLSGDTNIARLRDQGNGIWDANAYEFYRRQGGSLPMEDFLAFVDCGARGTLRGVPYTFGDLGRMYGYQWRRKRIVTRDNRILTTDPLARVLDQLKTSPESRQIVLDTYDGYDSSVSALPPCHTMPLVFNCTPLETSLRVRMAEQAAREPVAGYNDQLLEDLGIPRYRLSAEMVQRSGDAFLGVPFNITSTALLVTLVAELCGMVPGKLVIHVVNAHLYNSHLPQVREQLSRDTAPLDRFPHTFLWEKDPVVPRDIKVNYHTPYGRIAAQIVA